MKLAYNTWVIVADGTKYLILRQEGDDALMKLNVLRKEEAESPPAHELSSDRAGRLSGTGLNKSALQETDWHIVEKRRFAQELAGKLMIWAAADRFDKLVIAADPRTLGELRATFKDQLQGKLLAEIPKDFTNMPIYEIEAVLGDM